MAGRGPLPRGVATAAPRSGVGSFASAAISFLEMLYRGMPPIARLALGQQVRAWGEKAEDEARQEIAGAAWAQGHDVHETTGQSRP